MKTKTKFIFITVILGIVAFFLDNVLWPNPSWMIMPTSSQLPFFIMLSALEALLFGAGVAFFIYGRRLFANEGGLGTATFLAITWMMVSWWPHINFHRITPEGNYWNLLKIEYAFHFTLYVCTVIVARYIWVTLSKKN